MEKRKLGSAGTGRVAKQCFMEEVCLELGPEGNSTEEGVRASRGWL